MTASAKTAVLLLAHGSPDRPEDVPEFLQRVTGGRSLPPVAVAEIQRRYASIGRSPLTEITVRQGALLTRELKLPVYVGMRNWPPFIADVLQQMSADGVQRVVALCLAPQNSRTSVGLYRSAALDEGGPKFEHFEFIEAWHDHPLLIRAFAEKLEAGWKAACKELGARVPILFTAHSVPSRTILEGDPYEAQARETASLVAIQVPSLTVDDWSLAFQSQAQSKETPGGPWIGPTVEETILALKKKGHSGVFLQPIGFVCDHVEVLYDIDIHFRDFAAQQGMKLWRAESLNDSSTFIAALADVVRSRLEPAEPARSLVQIAKPQ